MFCLLISSILFARVGGAGGHSSSGGSHSSSSHSSSNYHSYSSGSDDYSGSGGPSSGAYVILMISVFVVFVIVLAVKGKENSISNEIEPIREPRKVPFPDGLDEQKVGRAFLAIQDAWQRKDLTQVRKWLSDGMYQRLTTQIKMMNVLDQRNILNNINIYSIVACGTGIDGQYQTVEVAISFSMDDNFSSDRYPQFNESYPADTATEYWTFIRRTDSRHYDNLYDNNNCPNCGALFEVKMGEISRCSNCNTLTNSAAYDWVLSEITQSGDYSGSAGLVVDPSLTYFMKDDPYFSAQRMEDVASNIFMQVMDVFTGKDSKRLSRFADEQTCYLILQEKKKMQPFVFDRLFLNQVTLNRYNIVEDRVILYFYLTATYRRASVVGNLQMLDNDFVTSAYTMELSRNKIVPGKVSGGETVYSYECSSCGAPYTDTTNDTCSYCDALVVDKKTNWVLTDFVWG